MDGQIIFTLKAILLTEAVAHAVKSWGIFNTTRARLTEAIPFFNRLLCCFECVSVWSASAVLLYLYFFEFTPFTYLMIFSRLAAVLNIGIDYLDALRALTINKL